MIFPFLISILFFSFVKSSCPDGSIPYNSNCYIFNSNSSGFAKAEITCTQLGGHLASIHDAFTNALLGQEAPGSSAEADFWIGANSLMFHGNWTWTDGSILDFTDWKAGEPENITGLNCVALSFTDGYWSGQDCFKNKSFVCALAPSDILTTTKSSLAPTLPTFVNCSDGWIYFQPTHSCYGVEVGGLFANWTAAENYCENIGAHLAAVHDFEEFRFLMSYVYVEWLDVWTGIFTVDGGIT